MDDYDLRSNKQAKKFEGFRWKENLVLENSLKRLYLFTVEFLCEFWIFTD